MLGRGLQGGWGERGGWETDCRLEGLTVKMGGGVQRSQVGQHFLETSVDLESIHKAGFTIP